MFFTFTTKDVISDKSEIAKQFNTFLSFFRSKRYRKKFLRSRYEKYLHETKSKNPRPFELNINMVNSPLKYFCCWEMQERGSWHCHLIVSFPFWSTTKVNEFFRFLESVISSCRWGFMEAKWTFGELSHVRHYLTKYCTKEKRIDYPGIRLVSYSRNFPRIVKLPFMWVSGKASDWRFMWRQLSGVLPHSINRVYDEMCFEWKSALFEAFGLNSRLFLLCTWASSWVDEVLRFAILNDLESFRVRCQASGLSADYRRCREQQNAVDTSDFFTKNGFLMVKGA